MQRLMKGTNVKRGKPRGMPKRRKFGERPNARPNTPRTQSPARAQKTPTSGRPLPKPARIGLIRPRRTRAVRLCPREHVRARQVAEHEPRTGRTKRTWLPFREGVRRQLNCSRLPPSRSNPPHPHSAAPAQLAACPTDSRSGRAGSGGRERSRVGTPALTSGLALGHDAAERAAQGLEQLERRGRAHQVRPFGRVRPRPTVCSSVCCLAECERAGGGDRVCRPDLTSPPTSPPLQPGP